MSFSVFFGDRTFESHDFAYIPYIHLQWKNMHTMRKNHGTQMFYRQKIPKNSKFQKSLQTMWERIPSAYALQFLVPISPYPQFGQGQGAKTLGFWRSYHFTSEGFI